MKKWLLAGAAARAVGLSVIAPASAEYKAEHRGGTMRLVARSAGGTHRPADQLHAAILADLPVGL